MSDAIKLFGIGYAIIGSTGVLIYATSRAVLCLMWMFGLPGGML